MILLSFIFIASALAQPDANWQFDFSSRVQMKATDANFVFERCDLDVCKAISEVLPKPPKDDALINELLAATRENPKHQFIADALRNYDSKPDEFGLVIHGMAIAPEKFNVHCMKEVADFLKPIVERKSKSKADYIFRFKGESNKFCHSGVAHEPVRSIDQVEKDVRAMAKVYKKAFKKLMADPGTQ